MRILVTNDDGIHAEGLRALLSWARRLGEVVVCAPAVEQSGKSHGIEIHAPFKIEQIDLFPDVTAYAVASTPADCVRFGILGLGFAYDLVLSGINCGYNVGRDIVYSGTVGAIFEAGIHGVPALALSAAPGQIASAAAQLDTVFAYIRRHDLFAHNRLYNINIPPESIGFRITRQGSAYYSDEFVHEGNGLYRQVGEFICADTKNPELDTDAIAAGYISLTPMAASRTDHNVCAALAHLNR